MAEIGSQNPDRDSRRQTPRVWTLLGRKAGDNTQIRALSARLGWPVEEKTIVARPWELLVHTMPGGSLAGIHRAQSSSLAPPWPDLIISAGRRNEPVARWIQARSGGHSRLVHLGRPWAALDRWDLIVTTPQYNLPAAQNILHNTLPLHAVDHSQLTATRTRFAEQLNTLPRPHIALMMGGNSGKFVFTRYKGARLGELSNRLACAAGGSLLVTSGPRTPAEAAMACEAALTVPRLSHRWGQPGENPYLAFLADADAFVVTGESMSMLAEAQGREKPLFIFDMGDPPARPWWSLGHAWRYKPLSHRLAMRLAPLRMRRDIGRIQQALIDNGRALWLDADTVRVPFEQSWERRSGAAGVESGAQLAEQELEAATGAIRALFD